jgi:hypothetical protein
MTRLDDIRAGSWPYPLTGSPLVELRDNEFRISIIHSTATRVSIGKRERRETVLTKHPLHPLTQQASKAERSQVRRLKGYICNNIDLVKGSSKSKVESRR